MNKRIWKIISIISAILAILFCLIALKQFLELKQAGTEYETVYTTVSQEPDVVETVSTEIIQETAETAATESKTQEVPSVHVTSSETPAIVEENTNIDFEALQRRNPDVYAWIEVPGTNVNYPILQHATDNSYYLTHTIDHEKTVAAAIYTENYNAKDFEDLHTVIYGHNMKNKTMFRTLHNFENYDFFKDNRDVIIYLPNQTRYYKVFAAYTYDNRHLLFSFDWSSPETFQNYIDEIMSIRDFGANIDKDMNVTGDDKIITLSTCVNSGDSTKRYLVQAVLVSIQNN